MFKNTSGQKWRVFAWNRSTNAPVTGDAANITAKVSIDYGAATALADTHPTEVEDGYYLFDLATAETNGHCLAIYPESSTASVQVVGVPGTVYTVLSTATADGTPAAGSTAVAAATDVTEVIRGDTWTLTFDDLADLSTNSQLYYTVRAEPDNADADSVLQATKSAGLVRLNGSGTVTAGDAAITITSASAPAVVTVIVKPATTAQVQGNTIYQHDLQGVSASGVVTTLYRGRVRVVADVSRATS